MSVKISSIRINGIEIISHSSHYELRKGNRSLNFDHNENLNDTIPEFESYLQEEVSKLKYSME